MTEIICTQCGAKFDAKRAHARFCSAKCTMAASRARRGGSITPNPNKAESLTGHGSITPEPLQVGLGPGIPPPPAPGHVGVPVPGGYQIPFELCVEHFCATYRCERKAPEKWLRLLQDEPGFNFGEIHRRAERMQTERPGRKNADEVNKFFEGYRESIGSRSLWQQGAPELPFGLNGGATP